MTERESNRKNRSWWVFFIFLAGLPFGLLGQIASVKAMGLGDAGVAYPQDAFAAVYNPAGSAEIESRWDLGLNFKNWQKELTFENRTTGQAGFLKAKTVDFFFPTFAMNKWMSCDWSFNLAVNTYQFLRTEYGATLTDFADGSGSRNRFDFQVEKITFGLGYRWSECHSFGVTADVYFGRFKLDGLDGFIARSSNGTHLTGNGFDYSSGAGATIGWIGHFTDCYSCDRLTLALSYSPKVYMRRLDRYQGFFSRHAIDIPPTLRAGLAYDFQPCATIMADVEYRWYSKIRALSNGVSPTANFGTEDGTGFGWRDQLIVKTGIDFLFKGCYITRIGYRFERLPYHEKSANSFLNVLPGGAIEHFLTAGLTWMINQCSEISAYFEYGLPRYSRIPIPTAVAGATLDGGDLILRSKSLAFGLAYGRSF